MFFKDFIHFIDSYNFQHTTDEADTFFMYMPRWKQTYFNVVIRRYIFSCGKHSIFIEIAFCSCQYMIQGSATPALPVERASYTSWQNLYNCGIWTMSII